MYPSRGWIASGCLLVAGLFASTATAASGATLILQVPITSTVTIPTPPPSPWASMTAALAKLAGVSGISYSRESGNANIVDVFVDFTTLAEATSAQTAATSGNIYTAIEPILSGTIDSYVVQFDQASPLAALNGAADTELAIFYLLPSTTPQNRTDFLTAFSKLKAGVESAAGENYATSGWAQGTAYNAAINAQVPTYVALVGWNSVAAHQAFEGTSTFGAAIQGLEPFLSGNGDSDDKLVKVL